MRTGELKLLRQRLRNATRDLNKGLIRLGVAARGGGKTMLMLQRLNYRLAFMEYRRVHGKLPGSMRTSRLRKKQHETVMRWYRDHISKNAHRV